VSGRPLFIVFSGFIADYYFRLFFPPGFLSVFRHFFAFFFTPPFSESGVWGGPPYLSFYAEVYLDELLGLNVATSTSFFFGPLFA